MHRLNSDGSVTTAGNQGDYHGTTWSNFIPFLSRQPIAERQAEGWYSQLIEGDVDAPTADPEQDAIIVPRPVPQVEPVQPDPLEPFAATIQAFGVLWASLNLGPVPSDWTAAMTMLANQPLDVQIKLLAFRVALAPVWDTLLERMN